MENFIMFDFSPFVDMYILIDFDKKDKISFCLFLGKINSILSYFSN